MAEASELLLPPMNAFKLDQLSESILTISTSPTKKPSLPWTEPNGNKIILLPSISKMFLNNHQKAFIPPTQHQRTFINPNLPKRIQTEYSKPFIRPDRPELLSLTPLGSPLSSPISSTPYSTLSDINHCHSPISPTTPYGRRRRTSDHQRKFLEELFAANTTPTRTERIRLGLDINMTQREIQVWFQNMRQKAKGCR
jgi:hypothetical protein